MYTHFRVLIFFVEYLKYPFTNEKKKFSNYTDKAGSEKYIFRTSSVKNAFFFILNLNNEMRFFSRDFTKLRFIIAKSKLLREKISLF